MEQCARARGRNDHQQDGEPADRLEVSAEVLCRHGDGRRVQQWRQDPGQDQFGFDIDVGHTGYEAQYRSDDHQHQGAASPSRFEKAATETILATPMIAIKVKSIRLFSYGHDQVSSRP